MTTGDILISIGITPNLRGFEYICMATEILSVDSKASVQRVYKVIADKKSTKTESVERTIRHAISKADRNCDWWKENIRKGNTVNSEFLSILAYRIREEHKEDD